MQAGFILPMLVFRKDSLPEGPDWFYESSMGIGRIAFKSDGKVQLRSRNDNDFTNATATSALPTIVNLRYFSCLSLDCVLRADAKITAQGVRVNWV